LVSDEVLGMLGERTRRTVDGRSVPRSVSRALKAMRAAPERALDLTALAAVSRVSTRTLQRHFQAFLGKTPQAVLRDMRFERARSDLLRASSDATVTDIALRCGFEHLGRFSVEYRRRYGEKPSQTLQRQARTVREPQPRPHVLASARDRATVAVVSTAATAGEEAIARAVAEELAIALMRAGVAVTNRPEMARYHLCASLRRAEREVRLTSRLIEPATGRHIWAHRHDGTLEDAFFFEESAAASVATAIQPGLRAVEIERARRKPDTDLNAQDLTLRALPHALSIETDGNLRALDLLERAINSDPGHTLAIALSAWCFAQRGAYLFNDAPAEERLRALSLARRVVDIPGDATVFAVLGNAFCLANDLEAADLVTQKALEIDGSAAWAWSRSGLLDIYQGRPGSAMERLLIALDLAPDDPLAYNAITGAGCAHFQSGCFVEAARWFERAVAEHPSATYLHQFLCPSYALCGDKQKACRSLADLRRRCPELTITRVFAAMPFFPRAFLDSMGNGLETVGLPP
jgi:AraC-like DNA-binding protein/tetratricopeptide (TPR) repeat protein